MSHNVRLTKLSSSHKNLRTDVIEGTAPNLPEKGQSFVVFGESLTPENNVRVVQTTEVQSVETMGNEHVFQTLNSTYKVEVLEDK